MGGLGGIVGQAIGAIFKIFQSQQVADEIQGAYHLAESIANTLGQMLQVFINAGQDEKNAWRQQKATVDRAGTALASNAYNDRLAWQRFLDVILPSSLNWLNGYVWSRGIVPLQHRVGKLESTVSFILGWRNQIIWWRTTIVDPTIRDYRAFKAFWNSWPLATVRVLRDWLQHPAHFAAWAVPPITGPLIGYLAAPQHKTYRDTLATTMISAWSEAPDGVDDLLNKWLLTPQTD